MSGPDSVRAFVAVLLSDEVKESIGEEVDKIRKIGTYVRWVKKENLHITLKFLGETQRQLLPEIEKILKTVAASHCPFDLETGEFGAFPNARKPRVAWIGLNRGGEELKAISRDLEQRLTGLGFEDEDRFKAHITLGRFKSPERAPWLEEICGQELGRRGICRIEQIHLVKSELSPQGPHYEPLACFPLEGSGG